MTELIFAALLGLLLGSFFNVVIVRLPRMMELQWQLDCGQPKPPQGKPYNLAWPGSHCPACKTPIKAYDNIPLLSYLFLRGRCRHCQARIHWQYPAVELISALVPVLCILQFGPTPLAAAYSLLLWGLLILSAIDLRHLLLPDQLSYPLLWFGLLASVSVLPVEPVDAIYGAAAGYLSLWLVYWVFKLLTGKEGLGYGDFKLLAVLGAWFGWAMLPLIILSASFAGALIGIVLLAVQRHQRGSPLPFAPFLAMGAVIALIFGDAIYGWYWQWAGFA